MNKASSTLDQRKQKIYYQLTVYKCNHPFNLPEPTSCQEARSRLLVRRWVPESHRIDHKLPVQSYLILGLPGLPLAGPQFNRHFNHITPYGLTMSPKIHIRNVIIYATGLVGSLKGCWVGIRSQGLATQA